MYYNSYKYSIFLGILPHFTKHPVDMKISLVDDNTNVALICEADGASSYNWEKKNGVIPSDSTGVNTNTLILINVQPEDSGSYRCVATNGSGSSLSDYAELIIVEGKKYIYSIQYKPAYTKAYPAHACF